MSNVVFEIGDVVTVVESGVRGIVCNVPQNGIVKLKIFDGVKFVYHDYDVQDVELYETN